MATEGLFAYYNERSAIIHSYVQFYRQTYQFSNYCPAYCSNSSFPYLSIYILLYIHQKKSRRCDQYIAEKNTAPPRELGRYLQYVEYANYPIETYT
jgi:hypothetical protein